ncbi:MAG: M1 family metallopeptidase [Winogradskyella sp.]|uniref:M1 family metallopeptidase n=1 Tax=Winogradskyella sp. TaxID=1883156 RepID=UPI0018408FFA|nr:M1 family metallopeptidase [Winogradskyella sp.]MBT8245657.1 M1 family metallopeptidase [Winogradskyella sp.]NNK23536.1 M1 family metallopeptidase [Winogradskyella sp.]
MKKWIFGFCLSIAVFLKAQQNEYVDFKKIEANIEFLVDSSKVKGKLIYQFEILKDIDSVFIDAQSILFSDIKLTELMAYTDVEFVSVKYKKNKSKLVVYNNFKADSSYELRLNYLANPRKALYLLKRNDYLNIWTQGQGKYTSHWLPSFDDMNEKVEFDLSIIFNEDYTVLANGKLDSISGSGDFKNWHYNMKKPMSSYLVALAIGKYDKKTETSKSGIPLEYYYYPEDSLKVEPTYRYTKQIFDFLEDEIEFNYPWQNYKQVPVHDFLYSGMENTTLTIFSDTFVVDSIGFNDRNYVNVNAHELAHQWFGDLVTVTSGVHHWLQEGFATYYALLAEKEIFGQDYFDFKLYNSAKDLGRQDVSGSGTSLLNPKSSSLTFYQRGAWVLYALRHKVGDKVFKSAVKNYLEKHQFANVETSDFISEVEAIYGQSLSKFVDNWIVVKDFPFNNAIALLKSQSNFIQEYIMVDCEANSSKCEDYLTYYLSDEAKIKVISQRPDLVSNKTFKESKKVRQAISQYVTTIPKELKGNYETLLDDASYLTIESALYNLWINFPTARARYLAKTKSVYGFLEKNVRLLWLVLNLNTPEYQSDKKEEILNELKSYTNPDNNFQLRINAFNFLDLIGACDANCRANLEQAKTHHNWRMVKFAKDMLKKQDK